MSRHAHSLGSTPRTRLPELVCEVLPIRWNQQVDLHSQGCGVMPALRSSFTSIMREIPCLK